MNETRTPDPWAPHGEPLPRPRTIRVPVAAVRPVVTYVLLGLTVLVFLGQLASEAALGRDLVGALGAKVNSLIAQGQLWRLITPVFVHAGLLHIAFNMYALYAIGPQVEGPFGHARFFFLYLYSGVAGVLLSLLMSTKPSVGASGAIFGLIGALAVYLYRHRKEFGDIGRQRLMNVATIMVINLVIGLSPGIDNWGHVGGLMGGAAVAWVMGPRLSVEVSPVTGQPRVVDRTGALRSEISGVALAGALMGVAVFAIWLQ